MGDLLPLFRNNSDPLPLNNNSERIKTYDPFGGQDLFANGRRNLVENKLNNNSIKKDRKPPIRHKWPHHSHSIITSQFEQMIIDKKEEQKNNEQTQSIQNNKKRKRRKKKKINDNN